MRISSAESGYASGRRDKSKAIKGLHEAIEPLREFGGDDEAGSATDQR